MANINLNDVRTPLTRKVNALYNVFASSNNLDDIENIADTLNCCADYGATVARKEAERQEAYSYLEGKDLCSRVTEFHTRLTTVATTESLTTIRCMLPVCRKKTISMHFTTSTPSFPAIWSRK